jgi:hypothetical protein
MITGPPPKFHESRDILVVQPTREVLGVGAAIAEEDPPWLALRDHYCLDSIRSSMSREGTARRVVADIGPMSGVAHSSGGPLAIGGVGWLT